MSQHNLFTDSHLINIWMVNLIDKTNGRRFIRISIWQFHPNLPNTSLIRTCHTPQNFAEIPFFAKDAYKIITNRFSLWRIKLVNN